MKLFRPFRVGVRVGLCPVPCVSMPGLLGSLPLPEMGLDSDMKLTEGSTRTGEEHASKGEYASKGEAWGNRVRIREGYRVCRSQDGIRLPRGRVRLVKVGLRAREFELG